MYVNRPGTCRVDVITHSMGGLVMRSFLAARPEAYARLVRKWVAMASPFGGAPGFGMDALLTGVQFCQGWEQYFFVNRSTMHTMCAQSPAVFELLPDPKGPHAWPRGRSPPVATVVCRAKGGRTATLQYSLVDFPKLLEASLAGYSVTTYGGREIKLEMNPLCWKISDAARAAWREARIPQGTQFFNIFGTGFNTAYDVEYGSVEKPVEDLTELAKGDPVRNFTFVEGDCTVPVCCATAGAVSLFEILQSKFRMLQSCMRLHTCRSMCVACSEGSRSAAAFTLPMPPSSEHGRNVSWSADGLDATERRGFFATHRGLLELPQVWEAVLDFIEMPITARTPSGTVQTVEATPADVAGLRRRRSAALRPQAQSRTKRHSEQWAKCAASMRDGSKPVAHAKRTSVGGDWVVIGRSKPCKRGNAPGDVWAANPLHSHVHADR